MYLIFHLQPLLWVQIQAKTSKNSIAEDKKIALWNLTDLKSSF